MVYSPKCLTVLAATALAAIFAPASAQSLMKPKVSAKPINVLEWQRAMVRQLPADQRFRGLPALRFGLLVEASGSVRTCLALPATAEQPAYGQGLCDAIIESAQFQPAKDQQGNAIDSVFVAQFAPTRATVAADYAGMPIL